MSRKADKEIEICVDVLAALENGRKIEAIKILREKHGLELKQSKDFIDDYLRHHPEVQARLERQNGHPGVVALLAVVMVCAVLYAGYKGYL